MQIRAQHVSDTQRWRGGGRIQLNAVREGTEKTKSADSRTAVNKRHALISTLHESKSSLKSALSAASARHSRATVSIQQKRFAE